MELKINFADQFLYYNSYNSIKTYYQLNIDEENALWSFIENLLDKKDLEGKNKPSETIETYDSVSKTITSKKITSIEGNFFASNKVWHYHFEHALSPYNPKQYYNKLTKPVLLKNLDGRTNSYFIHYFKIEKPTEIEIKIIGISQHSCWIDLYQIIK